MDPILLGLVALLFGSMTSELAALLAYDITAGLLLEIVALIFHAHDMRKNSDEGAASYYEQTTIYGYSFWLRNILLIASSIVAAVIIETSTTNPVVFGLLSITVTSSAILGRALFMFWSCPPLCREPSSGEIRFC